MRQKLTEREIHHEPHKLSSGVFRKIFRLLGPGFVAGASDDDPSGIGTYAVAGASLGFATL